MKSHSIKSYLCHVKGLLSSVCSLFQRSQSWGCWKLASGTGRLRSLSAGWRRLRSLWRRSEIHQCCPCPCFLSSYGNLCFCTGTMFTIFFFFPSPTIVIRLVITPKQKKQTKTKKEKKENSGGFGLEKWTFCHCANLCLCLFLDFRWS